MNDAAARPNDGVQEGHNMPSPTTYHPDFCQLLMGDKVGQKSPGLGAEVLHSVEDAGAKFLGNDAKVAKPTVAEAEEPTAKSAVGSDGKMNFYPIPTYEGYSGNVAEHVDSKFFDTMAA